MDRMTCGQETDSVVFVLLVVGGVVVEKVKRGGKK